MAASSELVIDYADLPSLVAVGLDPSPRRLVLYHPSAAGAAGEKRLSIVREHADTFGCYRLVIDASPALEPAGAGDQLDETCALMRAAAVAARLQCERVVWPRQVGPDATAVGLAVERASMAAALVGIGSRPRREPAIDLPVVDLSDEQVADLADDTGVPMRAFWPCGDEAGVLDRPCESCDGCRRWGAAFERSGVAWPWAAAQVC